MTGPTEWFWQLDKKEEIMPAKILVSTENMPYADWLELRKQGRDIITNGIQAVILG